MVLMVLMAVALRWKTLRRDAADQVGDHLGDLALTRVVEVPPHGRWSRGRSPAPGDRRRG
jgi:hypothetical protein